jgi:hypothetical protein
MCATIKCNCNLIEAMSSRGSSRRGVRSDALCSMLFQAQPLEVSLPEPAEGGEEHWATTDNGGQHSDGMHRGYSVSTSAGASQTVTALVRREIPANAAPGTAASESVPVGRTAEELRRKYDNCKSAITDSPDGGRTETSYRGGRGERSRAVKVTRRRDLEEDADYRR